MTSDARSEAEAVEEQGKYGEVQFTYFDIEDRHRIESQTGYVLVRGIDETNDMATVMIATEGELVHIPYSRVVRIAYPYD